MISVKELRIGNVITGVRGGKYVVTGLQDNRIAVKLYGLHPECPIESIEINACGIPLTEELLSKCELKKHIWGSATTYYHPLIELDALFC